MSARRNKIKPKLMEALQMLKFSLRQNSLDFTVGLDKDAQVVELEDLMAKELSLPTNIAEFVGKLKDDLESGDGWDDIGGANASGDEDEYFDLELDSDDDNYDNDN